MLFPSICDVIRNLSGMWQILFKDKYVRYLDVPQNYQDEVGGAFYMQEMQVLRDDLAKLAGTPITDADAATPRSRVYNDNRARDARALRLPRRQALAGADLRGLPGAARRHGAAGRRSTRALVREYLAAAERLQRAEARQRPRRAHRQRSASSRRWR